MSAPPSQCRQPPDGPLNTARRALHEICVETDAHREANDAIRRLLTSADVFGSHRGLALIGPSGSGKTSAVRHVERWLRAHASLPPEAPSPLPRDDLTSVIDAYLDDQVDELRNRFRRKVTMRDSTVTSVEDLRDIQLGDEL